MVTASIFPRVEEERYVALLQAANAIATCDDCTAASDTLVEKLREVTPFDFLHLVAFDKDTNLPCFSLMDATRQGSTFRRKKYFLSPIRRSDACMNPASR